KDNGPSDNARYFLSDALPGGTSFVSASPACTESSGTVTCTSSGLAAGDSESFTITVHVSAGYAEGGDLANTASIASNATADSTPGNDSSTSHTTVHTSADLSIHKDGPTDATAGDPAGFDYTLTVTNNGPTDLSYTLTVTNNGPSDAQSVALSDVLDSHLNGAQYCTGVGCTPSAPWTGSTSLGTIAAGDSATVIITATVDPSTPDGYTISN